MRPGGEGAESSKKIVKRSWGSFCGRWLGGLGVQGFAHPRFATPRLSPVSQIPVSPIPHSRVADPRFADPRFADPRFADPRFADPRFADPDSPIPFRRSRIPVFFEKGWGGGDWQEGQTGEVRPGAEKNRRHANAKDRTDVEGSKLYWATRCLSST